MPDAVAPRPDKATTSAATPARSISPALTERLRREHNGAVFSVALERARLEAAVKDATHLLEQHDCPICHQSMTPED